MTCYIFDKKKKYLWGYLNLSYKLYTLWDKFKYFNLRFTLFY